MIIDLYNEDSINQIKQCILEHEVISFDIFDTLIIRPFVDPSDVFGYIERKYSEFDFKFFRLKAQSIADSISLSEEIDLDDIYDKMQKRFLKYKDIEKSLEIRFCKKRKQVYDLYQYAKSLKKEIVIVSDMYLPEDTVNTILTKNGYSDYNLFLSSKFRVKKNSGNLYMVMLNSINANPNKVLHIGDNRELDYEIPMKLGIDVALIEKQIDHFFADNDVGAMFKNNYSNIDVSIILGLQSSLVEFNQNNDFWFELGYLIGGPVLSSYAQWVYKYAQENNFDSIGFIARDCYTIKRIFDYISSNSYKTSYIYANRKIKLELDLDFEKYKIWTDIYQASINAIYDLYKDSFSEKLDFSCFEEKESWVRDNIDKIDEETTNQKNEYKKYLSKELTGKNILIVDGSTMNFSAQTLIKEYAGDKNITGAYYFREHFPYRSNDIYKNIIKYECFQENEEMEYINWDFMEFILCSPEQSVAGMKDGKPIFNQVKEDISRTKIYQTFSDGAFEFAKKYYALFGNDYLIKECSVSYLINEYCLSIPPNHEKQIKNVLFQVFDNNTIRPIIAAKPSLGIKKYLIYKSKKIGYAINRVTLKVFNKKVFRIGYKKGCKYFYILGIPFIKRITKAV